MQAFKLGCVLRLPNAWEKRCLELNEAYVYTSAEEFMNSIVKGMGENGYSSDEVRIKDGSGNTAPGYAPRKC